MPIIQQNPGWSEAIGAALAGFGVQQKLKQRKQEQQRQADIDKQNAALSQAQIEGEKARTATEQGNLEISKGRLTLDQQKEKAQEQEKTREFNIREQQAKDNEQLKFAEFAQKRLTDAAQRAHLSAEDNARFQSLGIQAARLQEEINNHKITAEHAARELDMRSRQLGIDQQNANLRKDEFVEHKREFGINQQNKKNSGKNLPPIESQIQAAKKAGVTDPTIIAQKLIEAGYTQTQVRGALFGMQGKPLP